MNLRNLFKPESVKQQERAERQGCSGRCYWETGMCPRVDICDETWRGERFATIIGAISCIAMFLSVPLIVIIAIITAFAR